MSNLPAVIYLFIVDFKSLLFLIAFLNSVRCFRISFIVLAWPLFCLRSHCTPTIIATLTMIAPIKMFAISLFEKIIIIKNIAVSFYQIPLVIRAPCFVDSAISQSQQTPCTQYSKPSKVVPATIIIYCSSFWFSFIYY